MVGVAGQIQSRGTTRWMWQDDSGVLAREWLTQCTLKSGLNGGGSEAKEKGE